MESGRVLCTYCSYPGTVAIKLLDGLDAFACETCRSKAGTRLQPQRVPAPWSGPQTASLRAYQNSTIFYHYVCDRGHDLAVASDGMVCNSCSFKQDWAYSWSVEGFDQQNGLQGAPVPRAPHDPQGEAGVALAQPEKRRELA